MTQGFLDRRSLPDSPLTGASAGWKLFLFLGAALAAASEPRGELAAFLYYGPLIAVLAALGRIGIRRWALRCAVATPFLALSAVLPYMVGDTGITSSAWAASIVLRGLAAVALIALLAETTDTADIVATLQRAGIPGLWVTSLALALRYIFLISDEWRRVRRATACRAPGLATASLSNTMAGQLGLVFVRAWERAERIHGAMLARGFDGAWRIPSAGRGRLAGAILCGAFLCAFLIVRTTL